MARSLDAAKPTITILAGMVLLGVVLSLARSVLIPIALAILLSFTLTPAVIALQRYRLSRTVAVLVVMGASVLLISSILSGISMQLHTLAIKLPEQKDNIIRKFREIQGEGPGVFETLAKFFEDLGKGISAKNELEKGVKAEPIAVKITDPGKNPLATVSSNAASVIGFVGTVGLIIALTMAMLLKREDLRNRLIRLAGHGELTSTTRAIDEATRRISRYLLIQLSVNAAFGFIYGCGLFVIGVPYALLWGFVAFLIRFVPFIGTWLAGFLPLIFSFADSQTWGQPIAVMTFTVLLGILVNNVIEPLLISRSTGVSPVGIVIAAAIWTWFWGPIGLVLSTPLTVCLAVLGRFVPALSFFDVVFGTDPALDPQEGYYQRLLARDESEAGDILETYLKEHSHAELCDHLLIPALVRAKEDYNLGHLSEDDIAYITSATTELLDDLGLQATQEPTGATGVPALLVIGCPAKDQIDELALHLFEQLMTQTGQTMTVSTKTVASELIEMIQKEKPAAAIIGAVHPGGLAKIRYLIKRLHGAFPQLQIEVGYWGLPMTDTKLPQQLKALGAAEITTTMADSCRQMESYLRMLPHMKHQELEAALAPASESADSLAIK